MRGHSKTFVFTSCKHRISNNKILVEAVPEAGKSSKRDHSTRIGHSKMRLLREESCDPNPQREVIQNHLRVNQSGTPKPYDTRGQSKTFVYTLYT